MARTDDLFGLEDFARNYLRDIDHHSQVRTEHLAESFRQWFDLTPFPSLAELWDLCERLGVRLAPLEGAPDGLLGVNTWVEGSGPTIYLRPDLHLRREETTLGHELREVLEHAFRRVKPTYVGLDPCDNQTMNQESDQFAACLLMQADASRERLRQLGFDVVAFAAERGRSLPSVLLRAQQLFPAGGEHEGPVAGLWLFEAPWHKVQAGTTTPDDLVVRHGVKLCRFSTAKARNGRARPASRAFPTRGSPASAYTLPAAALAAGHPVTATLAGFDLLRELDFCALAEPLFVRGAPWRVLLAAVRTDCLHLVEPWRRRLAPVVMAPLFQTT